MVTKGEHVYCNRCDKHMGTMVDGEFQALPDIYDAGYLRFQVHDMQNVVQKFEGDYCSPCSKVVDHYMKEMKIGLGELPNG